MVVELKFLCCQASDCPEKVGLSGYENLDEDIDHGSGVVRGGIGYASAIAGFLATIGA